MDPLFEALVIGAGPAGLMAAEQLALAGRSVLLVEAKPSVGRKFLMAGKSGLNLTKDEPFETFLANYPNAAPLRPMLTAFGPAEVQDWARDLGQDIFTGSTGRVFPKAMKASPLLRAWLARLHGLGVQLRTNWRWTGWQDDHPKFHTPDGIMSLTPDVTVLALGGASWARLGSDGAWASWLADHDVAIAPFQGANTGLRIAWSPHMQRHFGAPVKNTRLIAGAMTTRGECVISRDGLEGGGIYGISRALRDGTPLYIDLLPDQSIAQITARLAKPRGKTTLTNHLRKTLRLDPARLALLMEFAQPLPKGAALSETIKALPIRHNGPGLMDQAISTAGGIRWDALDNSLMLRAIPGTFAAGEMLDWEAPTGGYLMTACLATGRWAGQAAADYSRR